MTDFTPRTVKKTWTNVLNACKNPQKSVKKIIQKKKTKVIRSPYPKKVTRSDTIIKSFLKKVVKEQTPKNKNVVGSQSKVKKNSVIPQNHSKVFEDDIKIWERIEEDCDEDIDDPQPCLKSNVLDSP